MTADPTKARLLEAAGEEFAEKGFGGATVRGICARAGANLAAVNYHFGDKEQLYLQAVIEAHRCGVSSPTAEEFASGGPAERLRAFVRNFLQNVLALSGERTWYHGLMLREMIQPTVALEVLAREVIRPRFQVLLGILREFCPEADNRKLNALAFSVIGQCLHYKLARPVSERLIGAEAFASLDADFLTEHITSFCLAALGTLPPLDGSGETSDAVSAAGGKAR